jgi:hypothetical protein
MLSRRALVGKLAVGVAGGAVALAAGGVGRAKAAVPRGEVNTGTGTGNTNHANVPDVSAAAGAPPPSETAVVDAGEPATLTAPPPWELVRPLVSGSTVAHGWSVADLSGVVDGVCVLTLRNGRGREHRVHLCRNDGRPQGLVYTDHIDLVVMNGGQGDLPTEEGLAQAVAKVSHVIATNERQNLVAELLPQRERERLFAGPVDRRLR